MAFCPSGSESTPKLLWTEEDELRLLSAVLEMVEEPIECFDPTQSQFLRLSKALVDKPFTETQILGKVKELRSRYLENRFKILTKKVIGVFHTPVFEISHQIWRDLRSTSLEEDEDEDEGVCSETIVVATAFISLITS